jgi:hypothetical protein
MHKNQFYNKYSNFGIHESEMERKWRLYEEEKALAEAMEALMLAEKLRHMSSEGIIGLNDPSSNDYVVNDYIDDYFQ